MKPFDHPALMRQLQEGIRQLALNLDAGQVEKLLDYLALLHKWNGVYNLTAVRDPAQMVTQHLLDSLTALPAFEDAKRVLDVGAGGGLPGMVLAIARPDVQVSMIDTVQKKTAFLTQVKAELGLGNVTVHSGRVEQLVDTEQFDVITSRAFAELADFVSLSHHLLAPGGQFIAMKGVEPTEEIGNLPQGWSIKEIRRLAVPGLQAERHLIIIERSAS